MSSFSTAKPKKINVNKVLIFVNFIANKFDFFVVKYLNSHWTE